MNTLYNLALRQSSSIQSDLTLLESTSDHASSFPSLIGQLTTSLAALSRTVDDYENMAKRELNVQKREKALQRVKKFREEEKEMQNAFNKVKAKVSIELCTPSISRTAYARGPPQDRPNPLRLNASAAAMIGDRREEMNASAAAMFGDRREGYALREHSFIEQTETQLDSFIAQGREIWTNLSEQRDLLKGTQRRLRDIGVTLGLSRDVIGYIERRSTQDNILFVIGAILTLTCFYYIYKWFG